MSPSARNRAIKRGAERIVVHFIMNDTTACGEVGRSVEAASHDARYVTCEACKQQGYTVSVEEEVR